ncbi:MAG TPA: CpsD/CapB family tyrosine-protein kinase [Terriglobales bacterium]|nr:CpsD/CapB family tyrosine-protein kinase [Terriglobales bacterium]
MSTVQNPATQPRFMVLETPATGRQQALPLTVRARSDDSRLVFLSDPHGVAAEQYRVIRRKLVERYPDGAVLLITSASAGDGKTLTSTNLAWCLAESGSPTLLAEMDLRSSSIDKLLGAASESRGIEAVLSNGTEPEEIVRQVNGMPLYIARAGRLNPNPISLLTGAPINKFLGWARENHKWVVLDSPPLFPMADSLELSAAADSTILVVRVRKTPRVLVQRAIEHLGPRLQQVVMNEDTECADSSHRYLSAYFPYGTKSKK